MLQEVKRENFKQGEKVNYLRLYDSKTKNCFVDFDSVTDVLDCVTENEKFWSDEHKTERSNFNHGDYVDITGTSKALFFGEILEQDFKLYEKTKIDLLTKYPELLALKNTAVTKRRKRIFADEGADLDIDRYVHGDAECWVSMPRQKIKQGVKMFFNLCLNSGSDAKEFFTNMALFVTCADIMEMAGVKVELSAGFVSNNSAENTKQFCVKTKVKAANMPLDINRMLTVGICGFFRYYGFVLIDNLTQGKTRYGLGQAPDEINKQTKEFIDADIICNSYNTNMVIEDVKKALGVTDND